VWVITSCKQSELQQTLSSLSHNKLEEVWVITSWKQSELQQTLSSLSHNKLEAVWVITSWKQSELQQTLSILRHNNLEAISHNSKGFDVEAPQDIRINHAAVFKFAPTTTVDDEKTIYVYRMFFLRKDTNLKYKKTSKLFWWHTMQQSTGSVHEVKKNSLMNNKEGLMMTLFISYYLLLK
jgi:hypothetical protein